MCLRARLRSARAHAFSKVEKNYHVLVLFSGDLHRGSSRKVPPSAALHATPVHRRTEASVHVRVNDINVCFSSSYQHICTPDYIPLARYPILKKILLCWVDEFGNLWSRFDADCEESQKCCWVTSCYKKCTRAVITKPGRWARFHRRAHAYYITPSIL